MVLRPEFPDRSVVQVKTSCESQKFSFGVSDQVRSPTRATQALLLCALNLT